MSILVINAGSSSLKFSVYAQSGDARVLHGEFSGLMTEPHLLVRDGRGVALEERHWESRVALGYDAAAAYVIELVHVHLGADAIAAVGHRVVHGGEHYRAPTLVSDNVLAELEQFIPLAPLHQPHNLAPIASLRKTHPQLAQVACFDTAFHRAQPLHAQLFALPPDITARGVRRYGFHGLSYEYIAQALVDYDARAARGRTVVFHLGNGASMCALQMGISIATTMGFTALDGLPMGTRSGSIDPGVLLFLMDQAGMDRAALEALLYRRSGLLGVSGVSSDMRVLLASQSESARIAVDLFVYRAARELGSLAAALSGLDAIVFTAGIGEHQPLIRSRICALSRWLGIELDEAANAAGGPRISSAGSPVSAWVIPTDEELMIARHTCRLLAAA